MKKLANVFGLCIILVNALCGQTEKGKLLLGASTAVNGGLESLLVPNIRGGGAGISFSTLKGEDDEDGSAKSTNIGFSPIIGYTVTNNLLLGIVGF
ncbi:MAG: hypothetical protein HUU01_08685 [Saprospiraceae bacterium]|nr:hypothetical protein [Saprospiraceae bacterium]